MRVLMGGASGMIGKALSEFLIRHECPVVKLVRRPVIDGITEIYWNPDNGELDETKLSEFDAVIHLGGYNIAKKVWSSRIKKRILNSRVKSTKLLAEKMASLNSKPKVFITASGMNIYGYNKEADEAFTESSKLNGTDFLSEVVREWESAAKAASDAGIRVVNARFAAVLGKEGGLLKKVLPVFKMAAGGKLGNGKQIMSWVDLDDAVGIIWHCLQNETLRGPVNVVAPNPVTNKVFTKALSKAVGLPAIIPVPEFIIKTVFAEMGEALMLSSIKCSSEKLGDYKFKCPTVRESLNNQLGASVEGAEGKEAPDDKKEESAEAPDDKKEESAEAPEDKTEESVDEAKDKKEDENPA